jgi:hypothetical protein
MRPITSEERTMTSENDRNPGADGTVAGKTSQQRKEADQASRQKRDEKKPLSDGDAIAELGDEVGGPA